MSKLHDPETIRAAVRQRYGEIASSASERADESSSGCCGSAPAKSRNSCCGAEDQAKTLGYSDADLAAVPEGANLGLGCGNPIAIASLKAGQTVLDLGAGAGFDAFLAARAVGPTGHVIGVDMTAEMVTKARANAKKGGYAQVEFRLGEIEALPVADAAVDVIISNCVINLSTDKDQVFREAFRVLKPGGRVAFSDEVARHEIPAGLRKNMDSWAACVAGAISAEEYVAKMKQAGFENVAVQGDPGADLIYSTKFTARKPS